MKKSRYLSNYWQQRFSWKVSWMDDWRWLHGLFLYCCKSESVAKKSSPILTGGTLCPCLFLPQINKGYGTPRHHLTVGWSSLGSVPPRMAWVALQWWQFHALYVAITCTILLTFTIHTHTLTNIHKYRHFQQPNTYPNSSNCSSVC